MGTVDVDVEDDGCGCDCGCWGVLLASFISTSFGSSWGCLLLWSFLLLVLDDDEGGEWAGLAFMEDGTKDPADIPKP